MLQPEWRTNSQPSEAGSPVRQYVFGHWNAFSLAAAGCGLAMSTTAAAVITEKPPISASFTRLAMLPSGLVLAEPSVRSSVGRSMRLFNGGPNETIEKETLHTLEKLLVHEQCRRSGDSELAPVGHAVSNIDHAL